MENQIQEWLQLGLIQKAESMFNTYVMCIQSKNVHQIGQDFRAMNKKLEKQSIRFQSVQETLGPIEEEQSFYFSTLDLSGPAWQLRMRQPEITAFLFPGLGQFLWQVAPPPHLGGAEAMFHRLLSYILADVQGVVIHVDW